LEQFERILTGKDELEKMDNRFTDYLIYLEQIKNGHLKLHRLDDHADYSKFKYVGPDGMLHKKPSANPQSNTRYYEKFEKKRISSPKTYSLKSRNNMKRVRHIELLGKHTQKENNVPSGCTKKPMETEHFRTDIASPRLERLRRQVLDLQDRYYSGQKRINQLTRELQLRTNKPEFQRRCQEIQKELCTKIDDVAWRQKRYERENTRLQKMTDRRTFTRVERAFTAMTVLGDTSVGSNANDISESFDQSFRAKLHTKLSTKEKIRQMQAMLKQLEHEVKETSDNASEINDWEDSDDGTEKKSNADEINDNKPAADKPNSQRQPFPAPASGAPDQNEANSDDKTVVTSTSAQAKLAKELIKLANTYKVPELNFSDQAGRRRFGYQT